MNDCPTSAFLNLHQAFWQGTRRDKFNRPPKNLLATARTAFSFNDQYAGHIFSKTVDVPGPKAGSQSVTCDSGKNQGRLKEKPPKARKFIRATGCIQLANLLTYAPIVLSWRTRNDSALDGDTRLSLAGWKSWSVKKAPSRGQEISVSGRRQLSRYRRFRRGKCLLPARFCLCAGYCDRCGPSRAGRRFPRNLQDRIRN